MSQEKIRDDAEEAGESAEAEAAEPAEATVEASAEVTEEPTGDAAGEEEVDDDSTSVTIENKAKAKVSELKNTLKKLKD